MCSSMFTETGRARRAVPDRGAGAGRRRGAAHRHRTRRGAHPMRLRHAAHRRRRLSYLRYTRRGPARSGALNRYCGQYCGRHASAAPGPERSSSRACCRVLLAGCAPGLAANPRYATDSGARTPGRAGDQQAARTGHRRSRRRRTTCRGGTARRGCSATQPSIRSPASRWTAPATTPTSTHQRRHRDASASAWCARDRAQTPPDAGPLVMTTGSDLPSSVQLPVWLSRAGADVLQEHPDRGGGPPRHRHVGRAGLPRPVRPPGDARPGPVPVRRRPRRQPRRDHA